MMRLQASTQSASFFLVRLENHTSRTMWIIYLLNFKIKTYQPNPRYNHNHSTLKPADRRAKEVTNQYHNKFKKLDKEYASEVVGDGSSGVAGPFEAAQLFIGGQVVPLVVGAFGRIKILNKC
jgi:hypothetical protein